MLSSVSGIGVYRNNNTEGPTMPQVYQKTSLSNNDNELWNFQKYTPQVVGIELGTNDFDSGDASNPRPAFDSARFVQAYIPFVQLVQAKYPNARIVLLSSPMLRDANNTLLQHCLTAVKNTVDAKAPGNKPIALYFFNAIALHGCDGHPSVEDHAQLAEELTPVIKNLLSQ